MINVKKEGFITYIDIWVEEECRWYAFVDEFDETQFKYGYVDFYTVVNSDGIIVEDTKYFERVGNKFEEFYIKDAYFDGTPEYTVSIVERSIRTVKVLANSEEEAITKVKELYDTNSIILSSEDFEDVEFEYIEKSESNVKLKDLLVRKEEGFNINDFIKARLNIDEKDMFDFDGTKTFPLRLLFDFFAKNDIEYDELFEETFAANNLGISITKLTQDGEEFFLECFFTITSSMCLTENLNFNSLCKSFDYQEGKYCCSVGEYKEVVDVYKEDELEQLLFDFDLRGNSLEMTDGEIDLNNRFNIKTIEKFNVMSLIKN